MARAPRPPRYVERVARLPEVLRFLAGHPDGLPLAAVADEFGVPEQTLREDLTTFLDIESWGWMHDVFRLPVVEFVSEDEDEGEDQGTVVRVLNDGSTGLGVEHVDAADLALVHTAGLALLEIEGDNEALAGALGVVAETVLGAPAEVATPGRAGGPGGPVAVADVQRAVTERRRLRIVYSRAWHEGVRDRVVEPLRMVQTRRGWEVDAGPVADDGTLRTFLLSHVREAEVLDETFEPPDDLERRLARQRTTTTVRVELPQGARWVADMYAERVTVVEEDESTFTADLELLAPVGSRVGLIVLAGGGSSRLLRPTSLLPETTAELEALLAHHEQGPS
jgi:predicted DNA-binding transcriptional regulator YafY